MGKTGAIIQIVYILEQLYSVAIEFGHDGKILHRLVLNLSSQLVPLA